MLFLHSARNKVHQKVSFVYSTDTENSFYKYKAFPLTRLPVNAAARTSFRRHICESRRWRVDMSSYLCLDPNSGSGSLVLESNPRLKFACNGDKFRALLGRVRKEGELEVLRTDISVVCACVSHPFLDDIFIVVFFILRRCS